MFRVELGFDTEHLDSEMLERLGEETDRIFESRNMPCESRDVGRRVYTGTGNDKTDFGQLWVALCKIKRNTANFRFSNRGQVV
jgi:hypothetical protein